MPDPEARIIAYLFLANSMFVLCSSVERVLWLTQHMQETQSWPRN